MRNRNKLFFPLLIVLAFMFIYGCTPKPPAGETSSCIPENLNVNVDDSMMQVVWENNCKNLISGYNIYINDKPNQQSSDLKPFNFEPFAGDTDPEDGVERYEAKQLENGKKYYVSVRIINPDRTLSKPSKEFVAVCGAREEITLSIRYKSDHDGYSFEKNEYVKADNLENDLYFFSKDGVDYISSPVKLDGFLKANKLTKLSYTGDFEKLRYKINDINPKADLDRVKIAKNDWLFLVTPDKKSALIKVLDISGKGEARQIKLFIAYVPIENELIY